jgi:hypothetical protein
MFRAANQRKSGQNIAFLMHKRGKIEKFHTCQAQRLEALFLWNPNGRLGTAAGRGVLSFGAEGGSIRVKPVSVSQYQKSPCQLVSMSIRVYPV